MYDRRLFLKKISLLTFSSVASSQILPESHCKKILTPNQSMGPFYPENISLEKDADLTQLEGHQKKAKGQHINILGIVEDQSCNPIENAIVEIWQACYSGRYKHSYDNSKEKLDPHFQYYAKVKTNNKGQYSFRTVLPGAYKASKDWMRPPHIHFKVSLKGHHTLVTQLYFEGSKYNAEDSILNNLSKEEKKKVIIKLKKEEAGLPTGNFIITLKKESK